MSSWQSIIEDAAEYQTYPEKMLHHLEKYKNFCIDLINLIAEAEDSQLAEPYFEDLMELQSQLSILSFPYNVDLGVELNHLVYLFERLDNVSERNFWFMKLQNNPIQSIGLLKR